MCASNSREGGADYLEYTIYLYEAGLSALTKTIAAKNSNYYFFAWQEERGDPDD